MRLAVTAVVFLFFFAFGFSTGFVGAMMPTLISAFDVSMVEGSYILAMINGAGFLSVLVFFAWGDRINKFVGAGFVFTLFTLSLFGATIVASFTGLLAMFFIFGFGIKSFDTLNNAIISDLHEGRRGVILNLMHALFSIGALSGPQFVLLMERLHQPWTVAFEYFAYGCTIVLAAFSIVLIAARSSGFFTSLKRQSDAHHVDRSFLTVLSITRSKQLWLLAAIFFSVFGVISIINTWLVYHFQEGLGSTNTIAKLAATSFWIGVLLSRLVIAPIAVKYGSMRFIRGTTALTAVVVAVSLLAGNEYFLLIGILLTGITAGQINPFVIATACDLFPERSAAVTAFLFLMAYTSQIFFPWFSGLLGETYGSTVTMLFVPLSFALIAAVVTVVIRIQWRDAASEADA